MIIKKEFKRDILYKIILKGIDNILEYCLVDANDDGEVYAIFEEELIKN